eukprot:scaffold2011_cov233-Pinguiococcus_pyrenoidosus.AAC.13
MRRAGVALSGVSSSYAGLSSLGTNGEVNRLEIAPRKPGRSSSSAMLAALQRTAANRAAGKTASERERSGETNRSPPIRARDKRPPESSQRASTFECLVTAIRGLPGRR